jgi:hypothetical protein
MTLNLSSRFRWTRVAGLLGLTLLQAALAWGAGGTSTFRVTSPDLPTVKNPTDAFREELMANEFGCKGGNVSPALEWHGAPAGTKSFAITMFDSYKPPVSGWWHWVVYDLPASTTGLPHGAGSVGGSGLPAGAKQGLPDGDAPQHHYYGPCPDIGDAPHHYVITIYALSVDHLEVPANGTAADIDFLIETKAIAHTSIERHFQRTH